MTLIARCHCGRSAFEIDGELPEKLTCCTCSFCSKRGQLYAYFTPAQLTVSQADSDAIYRWNSKTVAAEDTGRTLCRLGHIQTRIE